MLGCAGWLMMWVMVPGAQAQAIPGQLVVAGGEPIVFATESEMLFGKGYLGVEMIDLNAELRVYFGAGEDVGVLVAGVVPGSPAALAGLRVGDLVVGVDGEPAGSAWELIHAVRPRAEGDVLKLDVVRDKRNRTMRTVLTERERDPLIYSSPDPMLTGEYGATVQEAIAQMCGNGGDASMFSMGIDPLVSPDVSLVEERMRELEDKVRLLERALKPAED